MTTDVSSPGASDQPQSSGGFINFMANAVALFAFALMAVGLIAVTAHWGSQTINFVGADRVQITQSEWWGFSESKRMYRSTASGWVLMRENGDEVPVALQPIKVSD